MKKTFAAILENIGKPLTLCELEIPDLKPGQVLVNIRYSSICHTQINEIKGLKGEDKFLPHTLGHEGYGVVEAIGNQVTKVKPGDTVILTWLKGDGMNVPGTQYAWGKQTVNSGAVSAFMKKAVVSENRVVKASGLPEELMPLLGCAIPTGVGLVLNTLKPRPGQSIAIWGFGGIGMSALIGAMIAQCHPIFVIDVQDSKLELAKNMGATHALHGRHDPNLKILTLTQNQGVDFGVDAAGSIQTIESGYATIRKGGGRFVVAGNPPAGEKINLDPMDLISGKNISGTWGGESHIETDLPLYIDYHRKGLLPLDQLVTHQIPLEEINEAIELMMSGKSGRILLDHGNI